MPKGFFNRFEAFHAGRFLQGCLQESGFDEAWLADKTGKSEAELHELFAMPNMDAELFVRMGMPIGAAFWDRVHEAIFGPQTVNP